MTTIKLYQPEKFLIEDWTCEGEIKIIARDKNLDVEIRIEAKDFFRELLVIFSRKLEELK